MNKIALRAVARLTHINLGQATMIVRHNPLLGDEIHIEEELINLEEAINTYRMAADTLDQYPHMRIQLIREKRLILKHCLGLVVRMIHGNALPREYDENDTSRATKRLVELVVADIHRSGVAIDDDILKAVRPCISLRTRLGFAAEKIWDKTRDTLPLFLPNKLALPKFH
jgi:hypothetical protein